MLKLNLENFRRFLQPTSVSFNHGLTVIGGMNGTGKSTLIEALVYSLFGPKRGQIDIRSDNASREIQVECELYIDGQRVRVSRSESRAELSIDGVLQVQPGAGSRSMVNRQLNALLGGLTPEQFESTYVALQGDTAGLVTGKRDKRREIIEGILQLEVLKQAIEFQYKERGNALIEVKAKGGEISSVFQLNQQAQDALRRFEDARTPESRVQHAQRFQVIFQQVIDQRRVTVEEKKQKLDEANDKVKLCKEARDKRQAELLEVEEIFNKQKMLKESYQNLSEKIAKFDGQIEQIDKSVSELEKQITEAEACFDAAERYRKLEADIERYKQRLMGLKLIKERYTLLLQAQKRVSDLEEEIRLLDGVDELLEQAQRLEKEREQVWENLQEDPTTSDRQEWQAYKARIEHEEDQAREALRILKDHPGEARCPTCNQKFEEHTPEQRIQHLEKWLKEEAPALHAQLQEQEERLQQKKESWQEARKKAYAAWQQQSKVVTAVLKKKHKRDNLCEQNESAKQEMQAAQQKWNELEETRVYDPEEEPQLQSKKDELERQMPALKKEAELFAQLPGLKQQLQKKRDERQSLVNQLNDLKTERATLGYDLASYQEIEGAFSTAERAVGEAKQQLKDAESGFDTCKCEVEQAQTDVQQAERYMVEITEAFFNFQREDRLYMLLRNFQEHYFTVNTKLVTSRATQLLLHAISDQSILGFEFDGNDLYYRDASNHRRSINRLSGGEKALVGLCLRIALAERAQAITRTGKVRFLILDEVLSALDDERRDAVQRIFADVLQRGVFEHIIMITHLDVVKQEWRANRLEVRKMDSKSSEVISLSFDRVEESSFEEMEV